MIFAAQTQEQALYVFSSESQATAYCEGLDVEAAIWLFWDNAGNPLAPEFSVPNKRGLLFVENGKYHLVPAPIDHHADLIEALEHILHVEGSAPFNTVSSVMQHLTGQLCGTATSRPTHMDTPHGMTTLVLLPGMDGTGELFQPLLQALNPSLAVKVVRYPTHELLGYAELEAIVRAALPAGPYILLGESFSGPIAILIAASDSERLVGVILCCSFAASPRQLAAVAAPALSLPLPLPPVFAVAAALAGKSSNGLIRGMLRRALSQVAPRVLRHRLATALKVNFTEKLAQIKVPFLYMQATQDWLVPPSAAQAIRSVLPKAQVIQVVGPHLLLQVNPVDSMRAIESFVASINVPQP